jgi:hypothetical protein
MFNTNKTNLKLKVTVLSSLEVTINKVGRPRDNLILKLHSLCRNLNDATNCNCSILRRVRSVKYLGVVIDENLKWNAHIDFLCKKTQIFSLQVL